MHGGGRESRPPQRPETGIGGLADLEFIVQYLMLIHAANQPDLLRPNVWEALDALQRAAILRPRFMRAA